MNEIGDDFLSLLLHMLEDNSCLQLFNTCKYLHTFKNNGYSKCIIYDKYTYTYNDFILKCHIHFNYINSFVFKNIIDPYDWIPFDVPTIYLYNCSFSKNISNVIFKNVTTIHILNTKKVHSNLSMFPNVKTIYTYGTFLPNYITICCNIVDWGKK